MAGRDIIRGVVRADGGSPDTLGGVTDQESPRGRVRGGRWRPIRRSASRERYGLGKRGRKGRCGVALVGRLLWTARTRAHRIRVDRCVLNDGDHNHGRAAVCTEQRVHRIARPVGFRSRLSQCTRREEAASLAVAEGAIGLPAGVDSRLLVEIGDVSIALREARQGVENPDVSPVAK
jgi:hypothetical protein